MPISFYLSNNYSRLFSLSCGEVIVNIIQFWTVRNVLRVHRLLRVRRVARALAYLNLSVNNHSCCLGLSLKNEFSLKKRFQIKSCKSAYTKFKELLRSISKIKIMNWSGSAISVTLTSNPIVSSLYIPEHNIVQRMNVKISFKKKLAFFINQLKLSKTNDYIL